MLILNDGNDSLTLTMSGAAAVTEPTYHVAATGGATGPGAIGLATGAVAKTMVTGVATGPVRVEAITLHNADTGALTATIKLKRSSTSYQLCKVTLPSLSTLVWTDKGMKVLNSAGAEIQAVSTAPGGVGAAAGTGVAASESGFGGYHETVLTLTDLSVPVTDALAYASQKIYDFPEGRIHIVGVTANLQFGVTTARASTINDNAALKFAIGSAAASNATLATTMVDLLPKTSKTLDGAVAAYTTAVGAALAAAAQFDGTTTALDAYLNVAFETNTDIDADGTLKVSGTIRIFWVNLGDY